MIVAVFKAFLDTFDLGVTIPCQKRKTVLSDEYGVISEYIKRNARGFLCSPLAIFICFRCLLLLFRR